MSILDGLVIDSWPDDPVHTAYREAITDVRARMLEPDIGDVEKIAYAIALDLPCPTWLDERVKVVRAVLAAAAGGDQ